jgi:hypothetical protein
MEKISRQILTDLTWLLLSLSLTILISIFILKWPFLSEDLGIQLHDSFLSMPSWLILIPLFLLTTFVLYFIKQIQNSFKRPISNWILILTGMTLIISLTFLFQIFSQFLIDDGFTYPYPDAQPEKLHVRNQNAALKFILYFLIAIQIISLLVLVFVAYRLGKQRCKRKSIDIIGTD